MRYVMLPDAKYERSMAMGNFSLGQLVHAQFCAAGPGLFADHASNGSMSCSYERLCALAEELGYWRQQSWMCPSVGIRAA